MDIDRRIIKCIGLFCLLLMIAWLGGCADKKDLKDIQDPFYEQWRVRAEEAKGTSPVEPPPVDEEPFEIVSPDPADHPHRRMSRDLVVVERTAALSARGGICPGRRLAKLRHQTRLQRPA